MPVLTHFLHGFNMLFYMPPMYFYTALMHFLHAFNVLLHGVNALFCMPLMYFYTALTRFLHALNVLLHGVNAAFSGHVALIIQKNKSGCPNLFFNLNLTNYLSVSLVFIKP